MMQGTDTEVGPHCINRAGDADRKAEWCPSGTAVVFSGFVACVMGGKAC